MAAETLEGIIRADEADELGYYEVYIGDKNVATWAADVTGYSLGGGGRPQVKAILMIEDQVYLEAQGSLCAWEGEPGYSSWTPGGGPSVDVWDDAKDHDIIAKLESNTGHNAVLSLEVIA